jgi:hypothetical protein
MSVSLAASYFLFVSVIFLYEFSLKGSGNEMATSISFRAVQQSW